MNATEIVPGKIITIDNFFSLPECQHYISLSESEGYSAAPITTSSGPQMRPDIRDNERLILDDDKLAIELWTRISPFVPSPLWNRPAVGLNERLRFYRYDQGQTFRPHYDGSFTRTTGEKSLVTFMVYLNDDFSGGETRFDLAVRDGGEISVEPRTGMAILFRHHLLHEGAPVVFGRKYVLRTDVMYGLLDDESAANSSYES